MAINLDQDFRRERLAALVAHPDVQTKTAAGKLLGYSSGAYVRQLLAGERPITEKLIAKIEASHGGKFRGWFDPSDSAVREDMAAADDAALSLAELLEPTTGEALRALTDQVRLALLRGRDRYPSARLEATLNLIDRLERGGGTGTSAS